MGETPETDPLLEVRPAEPPAPAKKELPAPPPTDRGSGELWLETVVVLCVVSLPGMYNTIAGFIWPVVRQPLASIEDSLDSIFFAIPPAVLVLYLIRRGSEPKTRFGLVRPRWELDILGGIGLFLVYMVMWRMLTARFGPLIESVASLIPVDNKGLAAPSPHSLLEYLVVGMSCCAIGFSEELFVRGYLIPRFERLLGSAWKAVLASAFLFAFEHIYQGVIGVLSAGFLGLFLGTIFCWTRRVWPLALCHAIVDWAAITRRMDS